jgi:aarF domain-containing kinase
MAIDYKIVMSRNLNDEQYKTEIKKCHQRGADRILSLCKANGGVFIKVCDKLLEVLGVVFIEYSRTC